MGEPKEIDMKQSAISFILDMRDRIGKMTTIARANENREKKRQKKYFDKKARQ